MSPAFIGALCHKAKYRRKSIRGFHYVVAQRKDKYDSLAITAGKRSPRKKLLSADFPRDFRALLRLSL
jgi:hypothetical protein